MASQSEMDRNVHYQFLIGKWKSGWPISVPSTIDIVQLADLEIWEYVRRENFDESAFDEETTSAEDRRRAIFDRCHSTIVRALAGDIGISEHRNDSETISFVPTEFQAPAEASNNSSTSESISVIDSLEPSARGSGSYTCTFEGCTAEPFPTQYLLNSHMNIHSSTRPHFCPVRGCPRGIGGQGFKRKNEMIR